jgi:protein TonB
MDFSGRQQEPGKKFVGLGLVIIFHIILVYALANGLGQKIAAAIPKILETTIEKEQVKPPPPPDTPPPPPPKLLTPPPPFIPPPEVQVQQQAPAQNTIAAVSQVRPESNVLAKASPVVTETRAAGPSVVPAVIDFKQDGCKPEYPRASLRNEETGTVILSVVTGADGSVTDVKIDKSSGYRGLDNAVRSQLMSGSCKNKPGTIDGKPQPTTTKVQYVWKLD